MNDRFKKLTVKLNEQLIASVADFLSDNFPEEENIGDIIDLLISSHISCIGNVLPSLAQDNVEMSKKVDVFFKGLLDAITNLYPIITLEKVSVNKCH